MFYLIHFDFVGTVFRASFQLPDGGANKKVCPPNISKFQLLNLEESVINIFGGKFRKYFFIFSPQSLLLCIGLGRNICVT